MSRRLTRQEMKRDEVRDTLATIFHWIETHFRQILIGVAAMFVLGLIGTAVYFYLGQRQESAQTALAAALPQLPDPGDESATVDVALQRAESAAALTALREEFGGTEAARIGAAYLGSLQATEGDLESARSLWQEYAEAHPAGALASSVRVNLWSLDRQEGGAEAVAAELEGLLRGEPGLPEDLLLYQLAITYDDLERSAEAENIYQRLLDEHPGSAYAVVARQRVAAQGLS